MKIIFLILLLSLAVFAQRTENSVRAAESTRNRRSKEPRVFQYNRILEVGKTYRGQVNFGSAYGMTLTPFPKLPYHHSVMYAWTNVKNFSELDPDKNFGVRTIVFKVLDKEVDNYRKNNWITTFTIEIVRVDQEKTAQ
jgi:hypothetical protein